MLRVAEIYVAPQGEGPNLGRLSLFVRLQGCPLACSWCDSRFTWDRRDPRYADRSTLGAAELGSQMGEVATAFSRLPPPAVVFTGGEPLLLQRDLPDVIEAYCCAIGGRAVEVEVETAGTIMPHSKLLGRCYFNVSPKLASAGNEGIARDVLWNWTVTRQYLAWSSTFKLVVAEGDEESLAEYLAWLRECAQGVVSSWNRLRQQIYLMPAAVTAEELIAAQGRVISLAEEHGVNVTTRLHILAYGNERGK